MNRRDFLLSATAMTVQPAFDRPAPASRGRFGIAYTSFVIRMLRGRDRSAQLFEKLRREAHGGECR